MDVERAVGNPSLFYVPPIGFRATMTPVEDSPERPLFGGAISARFPIRFQDVSNRRDVPDNQEVFADPTRDESLVFELLELKREVEDDGSAAWFLCDLAVEQDAENSVVMEQSGRVGVVTPRDGGAPAIITKAVGQMHCLFDLGKKWNGELIRDRRKDKQVLE